jgi:hypothetical protein
MLWNAGQFRRQFFDLNDLPKPMTKIANLGDVNITFRPRAATLQARQFFRPLAMSGNHCQNLGLTRTNT